MKPYYIRIAIAHAEILGNKKWQKNIMVLRHGIKSWLLSSKPMAHYASDISLTLCVAKSPFVYYV